ncbi:hypothetical protein KTQ42_15590|uniref:hypothetical protein n=1 Tax=Noviherbaspirillum sp. L7-7A TaxID=2850560 RepID=UPI001C2C7903|nr:hypothetical protein [Noviherbaspirillum sp. L7-7A]MBV0880724.1 hypothetical protein [Noviherbaspirillum sp. L7-7A]
MNIFRAVPRDGFNPNRVYEWRDGQRLPGNVPYLVDNLWEFTRPEEKPSRRRAVYASPTVELALDSASAGGLPRDKYIPCQIAFRMLPEVFQLSVPDARHHLDVKRLQRLVHGKLANWSERGLDSKLALAPLFLPGTTREELSAAMKNNSELRHIVKEAAAAVTMWRDAPDTLRGEIIFEVDEANAYTLRPV